MTPSGSTFRTAEPMLHELLEQIHRGAIQLPDFQRGWVWDDGHIRALIASVSVSYPIGAVMLMETGGDGAKFKPRLVEGVVLPSPPPSPDKLILDGQQRMTSLYMALRSGKPVPTRNEKKQDFERIYYLNVSRCLDPEIDRLEAVVSLPPDRILRSDFARKVDLDASTPEKEFENGLFPLDLIFNPTNWAAWRRGFRRHFENADAKMEEFDHFEAEVWQRFQQYKIPVIELMRGTPKEAVCHVFEKVNTGGVVLSVFELLTAIFAADEFVPGLRQDWEIRARRLAEKETLTDVTDTDFLTSVTLLSSYKRSLAKQGAVGCKRKDILKLTLEEYQANADSIEQGLMAAARLLVRECIFEAKNIPYTTQLIPLAAVCAILGPRFEQDAVKQKLVQWYWCGVFGELYGGANEARYAMDIQDVIRWIDGGEEPRSIRDANFAPTRLLTLQTRLSAAYKGIMAQLIRVGANDFLNGDRILVTTYFDLAVEIHHIFPAAYCKRRKLDEARWNSIVNKAPLTAKTNRILSGNAPSKYLDSIEGNHGVSRERLDPILESHLIVPRQLRTDDFDNFIRTRATELLDLIEKAMGKTVAGRDSEEVARAFGGPLLDGSAADAPETQKAVETASAAMPPISPPARQEQASPTTPSPRGPFTARTFELLGELRRDPRMQVYKTLKDELTAKVVDPFKELFRAVAGKMPARIEQSMEIERWLFAVFPKNDYGKGGVNDYYWGAFYPRGEKKSTSAQLLLFLDPDFLEFGFYVGWYGEEERGRFLENCLKERGLLPTLIPGGVAERLSVSFEDGEEAGEPAQSRVPWRAWCEHPRGSDHRITVIMARDDVLRQDQAELVQEIAATFRAVFSLVLLATEESPAATIRQFQASLAAE
ncbi:MAG: DUF262 domain-containing protein [Planctomycetes bacterium]|nr:DUF262 domain-containing protein [Planctomycetota bacterium]